MNLKIIKQLYIVQSKTKIDNNSQIYTYRNMTGILSIIS